MSENLPNIDDLFRKALEDHEENPSTNVWANIDTHLDKKKVVFISKKYKKLKWVAAALLIFSAGMAMYTVHIRLKNKELVKQNEINRNNVLTIKNTKRSNGSNTDTSLNGKAANTSTVTSKHINADTPNVKPTTTLSTVAVQEKQSKHLLPVTKIQPTEVAVEQPEENVAVNSKVANGKKSTPFLKSEKTLNKPFTEKPSIESVEVQAPTAGDELALQKWEKNLPVSTVRHREINRDIIEPVILPVNIRRGIITDNIKTATPEKPINAENKVIKPFKGSRFSATVFYSKDFVSTDVTNDRHSYREDDRNEIKNKESISNSSSKGVLINYNTGRRWSLQSGLVFSSMTTDIQPKHIFARPDSRGNINYRINCLAGYSFVTLKTGTGPAPGDSVLALSSKNTLSYVGVPLALSYSIPIGRFTLQPGAGLVANFLTKSNIETIVATQPGGEKFTPDRIEGLHSSYFSGSINFASNYYFSKNIALNFTPVVRFGLSSINKNAPVKTYINSFGLAGGLTISF